MGHRALVWKSHEGNLLYCECNAAGLTNEVRAVVMPTGDDPPVYIGGVLSDLNSCRKYDTLAEAQNTLAALFMLEDAE